MLLSKIFINNNNFKEEIDNANKLCRAKKTLI